MAFNIIIKDVYKKEVDILYILGVLNSDLMSYYHRERFLDPTKTVFQKILVQNAKLLPIKIASKILQDKIVHLVSAMIGLTSQLEKSGETYSEKRRSIEKQMIITEAKINSEVYKIYSISVPDQEVIKKSFKIG